MCLNGNGALLSASADDAAEHSFDIYRGRLSFTHRFAADTEIVGPTALTVSSVTGTDDVAVFAGVRKFRGGREIGFNGSYGFPDDLVTHGMCSPRTGASIRRAQPVSSLSHPYGQGSAATGHARRTADRSTAVGHLVPSRRRDATGPAGTLVLLPQPGDRSVPARVRTEDPYRNLHRAHRWGAPDLPGHAHRRTCLQRPPCPVSRIVKDRVAPDGRILTNHGHSACGLRGLTGPWLPGPHPVRRRRPARS